MVLPVDESTVGRKRRLAAIIIVITGIRVGPWGEMPYDYGTAIRDPIPIPGIVMSEVPIYVALFCALHGLGIKFTSVTDSPV